MPDGAFNDDDSSSDNSSTIYNTNNSLTELSLSSNNIEGTECGRQNRHVIATVFRIDYALPQ
jgi:hypothetical protein